MDLNEALSQYLSQFTNDIPTEESYTNESELSPERIGNFTGSKISDLMTCKSRAKGKDWSVKQWLMDFGDTAINYVIEKAIERDTGQAIQTPETFDMRWGKTWEPIGKEYIEYEYNVKIQPCGFEFFLKNAGSTPDGLVTFPDGVRSAFELKCPAKVHNHVKHMNTPVDESHQYFWQIQSEMLSIKTLQAWFATFDHRFRDTAKAHVIRVDASPVHQRAIKFRCLIGEFLINYILEKGFKCDPRNELTRLSGIIPDNFEDWVPWFEENIKILEL